ESFELRQDGIDGIRPLHARIGRHALPGQQEAQEIARRDRLDLCPQALDRVAVNAGEQAALAPFFAAGGGRETPTHGEALGFERWQPARDFLLGTSERSSECIARPGAEDTQPTADPRETG